MNGDDIDDVANILSEGMRNLQLPVSTRWHTIIPSVKALDDPLIKSERDLLWKLGSARSPIDIFDKETWGGFDYTPLQSVFHSIIAVHPTQNQRVENHVQLAALVRSTNAGQARATARAMINYFIILRFNVRLVAKKNANMTNEATLAKVMRAKDKEYIMGFAGYMDNFDEGIVEMEKLPQATRQKSKAS